MNVFVLDPAMKSGFWRKHHAHRGRNSPEFHSRSRGWFGRVGEKKDAYWCWMMDGWTYLLVRILKVHGGRVLKLALGCVTAVSAVSRASSAPRFFIACAHTE
jgi:hypothetical protein